MSNGVKAFFVEVYNEVYKEKRQEGFPRPAMLFWTVRF